MELKIILLLLPFWIGAVVATLWVGFIRPKRFKFVSVLIEKACFSPELAISAEEAGLTVFEEKSFLKAGNSFGNTIIYKDGKYYVPEEQKEKAKTLYGKKPAPFWQALLWALALTVFFALLAWVLGKFVDTSALDMPWF